MAPIVNMHPARDLHKHPTTGEASMAFDDMHLKLQAAEQRVVAQARKSENLIAYFGGQLRRLTEQLHAERAASRTASAATAPGMEHVVRALLRFESKLRAEQSTIRQQMHDKDAQLNRLHREIVALRERHNDRTATPELRIDRIAQFCPACRKEYHLIQTKTMGVQADCGGRADGCGGRANSSVDTSVSSMAATSVTSAGTTTTTGNFGCMLMTFVFAVVGNNLNQISIFSTLNNGSQWLLYDLYTNVSNLNNLLIHD